MRLGQFIETDLEAILVEWEAFARQIITPAAKLSSQALRDHAGQILLVIVRDMATPQTTDESSSKSRGLSPLSDATFATSHGALRHLMGFSLAQLVSEFRALRASVLRRYDARGPTTDGNLLRDVTRFNEGIDQALAESTQSYSAKLAESRDTFLAILGHDLRSPLNSLRSCLHLLERDNAVKPTRDRVVEIGVRSIDSMDEMIGQLIDFTRRGLGRGLDVHPRPGNLGALCEGALEEIRIAHPSIPLTFEATGDLAVRFDPPRMRQVLINLLANAIQHGDAEAGIVLTCRGIPQGVTVTVMNRGTPIAVDSLMDVFDPLVRFAAPPGEDQKPSTSLGLGLFISREIVVAHGGRIEVTSTEEDGTAFAVHLPRPDEVVNSA